MLKIPAYRLGLSVDVHGRLERVFVDLSGYEPMGIVFSEDSWSVDGGFNVERSLCVGTINPLFQVVFKSKGACRLVWNFTAEFYGTVLLDRDFVEVDGGCKTYVPIYFYYDMVKRICRRTVNVVFKGPGECVFQLHMHRDFYYANGFSGVVIVVDPRAKEHYKLPVALLTLGLVPKPKTELLRLMHKYYTPIVVLEEPIEESVEALKYLLENVPINAVILPEDRGDALVSRCPGLKDKKIIRYDAREDAYSEASRVYGELFGSKPILEGSVEASDVKGWVEAAAYAHLKSLKIADGLGGEFEEKTSEALFNLRVMLEEAVSKDGDTVLSVNPPFKDLEEYCLRFSEDILGLVSQKEIYDKALSLLYRPRSITVTVLDEPGLQVALTAAAYSVSRNTPLLTVESLSQEDREAVEKRLGEFAGTERKIKDSLFQDAFLKAIIMERKGKDEALKIARMKVEMREIKAISNIMKNYIDPDRLKGYYYISLFTEPQALYELLEAGGRCLALDHAFGRLTGLKPKDALKLASSSTLTSINPPMEMNACSIGIGDEKDPGLDAAIMAMATIPYHSFKKTPELGVEPKLYLKSIYHRGRLEELIARLIEYPWFEDVKADVEKSLRRIGKPLLEKPLLEESFKKFKLIFMYLHGGRDSVGFFLKTGRRAKLYDRDIIGFKPFESKPFIVLFACRAGMADLNTNVGLATALISRGAVGVLANPVPISVDVAHRFAWKMLDYLSDAGKASQLARLKSFADSLDPQHLLFILYGEPSKTMIPQHTSSLFGLDDILAFEFNILAFESNTSEDSLLRFLLRSLASGLRAKLIRFTAGLLERDRRLHRQPDLFIKYMRAFESYVKGEERLQKVNFLTRYRREDSIKRAIDLAEKTVEDFKKASEHPRLSDAEACASEAEASKTFYKARLSMLEAFRLMEAGGDRGLVKDKASEAGRLYRDASKLLIEAADKFRAGRLERDRGRCLDNARICEAYGSLRMEAFISHIDGRLIDEGNRMLEAYLKTPKTEAYLDGILDFLFKACSAYDSGLGDGVLKLKLAMAYLLFRHSLLLKRLSGMGYRLERVRAYELCDDFKPPPEALKHLEELVEKAEETSINYEDHLFKYSLEELKTIYLVEYCKSISEIHTYVAYTYLILKSLSLKLDDYSNPEALKQAWESLSLPALEGFEKYLETWHKGL